MSTLSDQLIKWHGNLAEKPDRKTARKIIKEYFSCFGKDYPGHELWNMTISTLTNAETQDCQSARERHNILFFYEFTKIMLEASWYLREKDKMKYNKE